HPAQNPRLVPGRRTVTPAWPATLATWSDVQPLSTRITSTSMSREARSALTVSSSHGSSPCANVMADTKGRSTSVVPGRVGHDDEAVGEERWAQVPDPMGVAAQPLVGKKRDRNRAFDLADSEAALVEHLVQRPLGVEAQMSAVEDAPLGVPKAPEHEAEADRPVGHVGDAGDQLAARA